MVILGVLNKLSIGAADDGFAIEVVEYGRFKALETAVFNPVQPPQRQWSESRLTCDSSTQCIHVVDDLRNVVHVLYVGRHADQLAIDYVGLNVRDVLIQLAFRRTLVKPVHLERSRTEWSQCKPQDPFRRTHAVHQEAFCNATQRRAIGVDEGFLARGQAEQIHVMGFGQFPHLVVSAQLVSLVQWPGQPRREHENFHRSKMRWME